MKKVYEEPDVLIVTIEDVITDLVEGPSGGGSDGDL